MSKLKAFADDKIIVISKIEFWFWKSGKHYGKRRKCWLLAFSPCPTIFLKDFLLRVVKSCDYVVKSKFFMPKFEVLSLSLTPRALSLSKGAL